MEGIDLFEICRYGNLYLLKLITTRENVDDIESRTSCRVLDLCAGYGHLNCVTWLVDELDATITYFTFVNTCNRRMYACLEFLLQRKSKCDISKLLFSYTDSPKIIGLLLNAKANPNVQHLGNTALEWTIKHPNYGSRESMRLIIDAGGTAKDVPEHIYDYYETTQRKRKNCDNAMIALYLVLHRYKFPKDIIKVIVNMIRPSRNSELWNINESVWNKIMKWFTIP